MWLAAESSANVEMGPGYSTTPAGVPMVGEDLFVVFVCQCEIVGSPLNLPPPAWPTVLDDPVVQANDQSQPGVTTQAHRHTLVEGCGMRFFGWMIASSNVQYCIGDAGERLSKDFDKRDDGLGWGPTRPGRPLCGEGQKHRDAHDLWTVRVVVELPSVPGFDELLSTHIEVAPGGPIEDGATLFGSGLMDRHVGYLSRHRHSSSSLFFLFHVNTVYQQASVTTRRRALAQ
jgi:hypothetical protein